MENTPQYEQSSVDLQNEWPTSVEKRHSIPGILSSIIVLVMFLGSILSILLLSSAVGDYKELAEETYYTYDILIEEMHLDFATFEQEQKFDRADMKLGLSFLIGILTGLGYLAGFILGIVGLVIANKKKLFAILGLIFSIILPIAFFITGLVIFIWPVEYF
ncbi:MAG: hypothetical protein LRY71_06265 [Bacillaceae bacterium]|nr:hypothetical protein [Bacillaceae bacterium]